jgi:hypothetical protein
MFDTKTEYRQDDNTHFPNNQHHDEGREEVRMERFGPCRMKGCSCSAFKRTPSEEQFCSNCGHPRSQHIH